MKKINRISILMHLLSKKAVDSKIIGVTKKKACDYLHIPKHNRDIYFQELITNLAHYVKPLGLEIRFNAINDHWYLSFEQETSAVIEANPFSGKPRLPATLFCILTVAMMHSGKIKVKEVQNLRNKKGIHRDLRELEDLGYILLDEDKKGIEFITLTPLIGYELDLEQLSLNLALNTKKE